MAGERRICNLPTIRISESLEVALMRLASRDERSLSDYVWRVLEKHAFGHASSLGDLDAVGNEPRAMQCASPVRGV